MRIRPGQNLVRTAAVLLVLASLTFVSPDAPWLLVSGFTLIVAVVVAGARLPDLANRPSEG